MITSKKQRMTVASYIYIYIYIYIYRPQELERD